MSKYVKNLISDHLRQRLQDVHDALLVEAPADKIDRVVADTQAAMAEASRIVLNGFLLRTEAEVVCYPERYMDVRGKRFWQEVMSILDNLPP